MTRRTFLQSISALLPATWLPKPKVEPVAHFYYGWPIVACGLRHDPLQLHTPFPSLVTCPTCLKVIEEVMRQPPRLPKWRWYGKSFYSLSDPCATSPS